MKLAIAAFALAALPSLAQAQEPFSMLGTWTGEATAVHVGANPYRPTDGSAANLPDNTLVFTFTIDQQKGNRFAGTVSAGDRSETLIGALSPDGATGVILDEDGEYALTIADADTVHACYRHTNAAGRVVACYPLKRAQ